MWLRQKRRQAKGTGGGRRALACPRGSLGSGTRPAALALALAALALVPPASAGAAPARYVFEMCDWALPGGGDRGVQFITVPGVALTPSDTCAELGGSLAIAETGQVEAARSYWSVPIGPPSGGTIESIAVSGAGCGWSANTEAFILSSGWPANSCLQQSATFRLGSVHGLFRVLLGCNGTSSEPCGPGPWVYAHYFATTEVDPVAPTVAKLGGSLLSGGAARGHQTLNAEARDEGGGLSNVSVLVNGLPAAPPKLPSCDVAYVNNPSVQGIVASAVTPCPAELGAEWTLDTQAYPFHQGAPNTVEVCASDFATLSAPNTTCTPPQTISVDNSCTPSPVPGGEALSARFSGSESETVTVGFGKGAEVSGQLTDGAGDPVGGATICVKAKTLGVDAQETSVATVKTDAAGNYTYAVPPGPNREIFLGYRHDASQVGRAVRYYAHAGPSLSAHPRRLRNGRRVRFVGQLPGPSGGGRVVVMQASAPSSRRWITFSKATTDGSGRFRSGYRFVATTRTTTYRFRAVVPDQAGYPWLEGASRPVKVRVRE